MLSDLVRFKTGGVAATPHCLRLTRDAQTLTLGELTSGRERALASKHDCPYRLPLILPSH